MNVSAGRPRLETGNSMVVPPGAERKSLCSRNAREAIYKEVEDHTLLFLAGDMLDPRYISAFNGHGAYWRQFAIGWHSRGHCILQVHVRART